MLAKSTTAPPLATAFAVGQASSTKRGAGKAVEDADALAEPPRPKRASVCGPRPAVERAPTALEQLTLPGDSQLAEQPADVRQAATEQLPGTRTPEEPAADAGTAAVEEPAALAAARQAAAEPAAEIEAAELPGWPDQAPAVNAGAAAIGGPPAITLLEPPAVEEPATTQSALAICARPGAYKIVFRSEFLCLLFTLSCLLSPQ